MRTLFGYSFASWIAALIGFLAIPISTRVYSQDVLGQLNLLLSVALTLSTISCAGIDQGYIRFYFEEKGARGKAELLAFAAGTSLIIAFLVGLCVWCSKSTLGLFLGFDAFWAAGTTSLLVISFVVLRFCICSCRVADALMPFTCFTLINTVFNKCIYLVNPFEKDIDTTIGTIVPASILVSCLCGAYLLRKIRGDYQPGSDMVACRGEVLRYSTPLMPAMLMLNLNSYIPLFAIRSLVSFDAAGLYSMTVTLTSVVNIIGSGINSFWPTYVFKNYKRKQDTIQFFHKVLVAAFFALFSILIISRDLVSWYLGPGYENASVLFSVLLLGPVCYSIGETTGVGIQIAKKSRIFLVIYGAGIILNGITSFVLCLYFGVMGAALSSSLTAIILLILKTVVGNRFYDSIGSYRWMIAALLLAIVQIVSCVIGVNTLVTCLIVILTLIMFPVAVGFEDFKRITLEIGRFVTKRGLGSE